VGVRIYLPMTASSIEALLHNREIVAPIGYAVTPALREWYESGDEEELEFSAQTEAARASLSQLNQAPWRRAVIAIDWEAATPTPERGRAAVSLDAPVPWNSVASALIDHPDAAEDVERAAKAIHGRDSDAEFLIDQAQSHELLWFATQELGFIF
jgi:hypothetical protein